jgi:biopolymer transport protein ExbD
MTRLHSSEGVELNVTAMLDMAFQLLAFFVLTFRPDPFEPGFEFHMPPAMPVVDVGGGAPGNELEPSKSETPGYKTLRIGLFSESGGLDRMTINDAPVESLDDLRQKMDLMLLDPSSPIEQVVVQASDRLQYDSVMRVVDMCAGRKLPKIKCKDEPKELLKLSLVAMGDGGE